MKQERKPEEWLGAVYEFLFRFGELVRASDGTVVKRIGDEIMATFQNVDAGESFLASVIQDQNLSTYQFKIALDAGQAYHFRFIEDREDDPYGTVVDRCARIAKYSRAGFILCSGDYYNLLSSERGAPYIHAGSFPLKGLTEKTDIYLRSVGKIDPKNYLDSLLSSINPKRAELNGFTTIGRKLTVSELQNLHPDSPKPFVARELLNLPRCPYSAIAFFEERKKAPQKADKEYFDNTFLGYIVEWNLYFSSYSIKSSSITVTAKATSDNIGNHVILELPRFSHEIVRLLQDGQPFKARGVLMSIYMGYPWLDYVDLEFLSVKENPPSTKSDVSKGFFRR